MNGIGLTVSVTCRSKPSSFLSLLRFLAFRSCFVQFGFRDSLFQHILIRSKMENDNGEVVDLYIPRKCSASNRIIHAKDHASIQMSFVDVDENGQIKNSQTAYAICGALRRMGESDDCINRLAKRSGLLPKNF